MGCRRRSYIARWHTLPIVECGFAHLATPAAVGGVSPADTLVTLGPTIHVDIGFDVGVYLNIVNGQVPPAAAAGSPLMQQVPALIDTGALQSCIDEDLAQHLALPLVNQQTVAGVGGSATLNVYLAYLAIPALGTHQAGMFTGAKLSAGGQPHKALIGRTLLQGTLFVYDGASGSVKIAR